MVKSWTLDLLPLKYVNLGDLEPQTLNLKMGDFPFFKVAQPNELTVVHRDYEQ